MRLKIFFLSIVLLTVFITPLAVSAGDIVIRDCEKVYSDDNNHDEHIIIKKIEKKKKKKKQESLKMKKKDRHPVKKNVNIEISKKTMKGKHNHHHHHHRSHKFKKTGEPHRRIIRDDNYSYDSCMENWKKRKKRYERRLKRRNCKRSKLMKSCGMNRKCRFPEHHFKPAPAPARPPEDGILMKAMNLMNKMIRRFSAQKKNRKQAVKMSAGLLSSAIFLKKGDTKHAVSELQRMYEPDHEKEAWKKDEKIKNRITQLRKRLMKTEAKISALEVERKYINQELEQLKEMTKDSGKKFGVMRINEMKNEKISVLARIKTIGMEITHLKNRIENTDDPGKIEMLQSKILDLRKMRVEMEGHVKRISITIDEMKKEKRKFAEKKLKTERRRLETKLMMIDNEAEFSDREFEIKMDRMRDRLREIEYKLDRE